MTTQEIILSNALRCRKLLPNYSVYDLEDLEQEARIAAWKAIKNWDHRQGTALATYTTGCVRNALGCIVRQEYRKHRIHMPVSFDALGDSIEGIKNQDPVDVISTLISTLPSQIVRVIALLIDGYSVAAVAKEMGLPKWRVLSHISAIRDSIREI